MTEQEFGEILVESATTPEQKDIARIVTGKDPLAELREVAARVPLRFSFEEAVLLKQRMDLVRKEATFLKRKKDDLSAEKKNVESERVSAKLIWHCLPTVLRIVKRYQNLGVGDEVLVNETILATQGIINGWHPLEVEPKKMYDRLRHRIIVSGGRKIRVLICRQYGVGFGYFPTVDFYFRCRKVFEDKYGYEAEPDDLEKIREVTEEELDKLAKTGRGKQKLPRLKRRYDSKRRSDPWQGDVFAQIHLAFTSRQPQFEKQLGEDDFRSDKTPEKTAFRTAAIKDVRNVLATLSEREQIVLIWRYGLYGEAKHSLEEIAEKFEVTREKIREVEAKALRRLRHPVLSRRLRSYIDTDERSSKPKLTPSARREKLLKKTSKEVPKQAQET